MDASNPTTLNREEINERFKILQYKVFETQIEKLWAQFEEAGYQPVLIKGWAAAQLYPEPFRRQFTDIDFIICPSRYDEAVKFKEDLKESVPVDLHKGARHLDRVDFKDLYSNAVSAQCGGTSIRILRPEDHLRILSVHWLNDGGADREKLWDIYYAVAHRPADFDWERLLNIVSLRRRRWIICAIGLAHKYLHLDIEETPVSVEARQLPNWLIKAVEKEWQSHVRLQPLHYVLGNKAELWKQIKKRIPPNPIQATIEVEGDFDKNPRLVYQLRSMLPRLMPSVKRINQSLKIDKIKKL